MIHAAAAIDTVAEHEAASEYGADSAADYGNGIGKARIVQLKPGASATPPGPSLFLIPGLGGRITGFATLGREISTPMPVFAIEARGVDGVSEPDHEIEAIVQHYIERIRSVQPDGPYFLIGHSFGGMVAYEVAQRFLAMQERVACLILLDTYPPQRYWPLRCYLRHSCGRLHGHLQRIMNTPLRQSIRHYNERLMLRRRGLQHIPKDLKFGHDAARMVLAYKMLAKKWSPDQYPECLTLFFCQDNPELPGIWRARARNIDPRLIMAGHLDMLERPYVSLLANDISMCLADAASAC